VIFGEDVQYSLQVAMGLLLCSFQLFSILFLNTRTELLWNVDQKIIDQSSDFISVLLGMIKVGYSMMNE
jgi:hypothetical protein